MFDIKRTLLKKMNLYSLFILLSLSMVTGCGISLYDAREEGSSIDSHSESNLSNDLGNDIDNNEKNDENSSISNSNNDSTNTNNLTSSEHQADLSNTSAIDDLIQSMSLEEKVAQLFIVDFYGMTGTYQVKSYTGEISDFMKKHPVGGVIYFAENIESREQLIKLNKTFQDVSNIPLFIGIDEEGGLVSRLGKSNVGVTHLPSANELSLLSIDEVTSSARDLGKQLSELGFNFDFAPVLDVNTNPNNPVIGDRSFSADPEVVAKYGIAFSNGLIDAGILTSGKHFPGHGDTSTDSHLGITIVEHDLERLKNVELIPFVAAIENNIPSIMMGHISTPNITGDNTPASLSTYMITTLLREEMGFDGLVLTDSLRMEAITDFYTPKEVGVMLLQAGGDIILIPDDFEATYNGILDAVKTGTLTEERIDVSLRRILKTKAK